jgi:hypothetical protein
LLHAVIFPRESLGENETCISDISQLKHELTVRTSYV